MVQVKEAQYESDFINNFSGNHNSRISMYISFNFGKSIPELLVAFVLPQIVLPISSIEDSSRWKYVEILPYL